MHSCKAGPEVQFLSLNLGQEEGDRQPGWRLLLLCASVKLMKNSSKLLCNTAGCSATKKWVLDHEEPWKCYRYMHLDGALQSDRVSEWFHLPNGLYKAKKQRLWKIIIHQCEGTVWEKVGQNRFEEQCKSLVCYCNSRFITHPPNPRDAPSRVQQE